MLKNEQSQTAVPVLDVLNRRNPHLHLASVFSEGFDEYGRIVSVEQEQKAAADELFMEAYRLSNASGGDMSAGALYTADFPELHHLDGFSWVQQYCFGGLPMEAGCCWGVNQLMNGMEYHKSSELLGAVTDLVLFLGKRSEMTKTGWESQNLRAFYVPGGSLVELYSTTLHLAPVSIDGKPFYAVIMLPEGTNTELSGGVGSNVSAESAMSDHTAGADVDQHFLYMQNKWMLAHPDSSAARKGAPVGITGPNVELIPIENCKLR